MALNVSRYVGEGRSWSTGSGRSGITIGGTGTAPVIGEVAIAGAKGGVGSGRITISQEVVSSMNTRCPMSPVTAGGTVRAGRGRLRGEGMTTTFASNTVGGGERGLVILEGLTRITSSVGEGGVECITRGSDDKTGEGKAVRNGVFGRSDSSDS